MARRKVEEGVDAAKRLERHLEEIVTEVATKETMTHLMGAGMQLVQAGNAALKQMEVPDEAKLRIHMAEKEVLLAARSVIDAVLAEIDKEIPDGRRSELEKVHIKRKSK